MKKYRNEKVDIWRIKEVKKSHKGRGKYQIRVRGGDLDIEKGINKEGQKNGKVKRGNMKI